MANFPIYDKGDWDAICDSCGRKFKASELRLRWDGLRVCKSDWETRQPQDFVRAKIDIQAVPWSRPESSDTFVPLTLSSTINDTVTLKPGGGDTARYIDPTYFLQDYLYNGAVEPELIFSFGKNLLTNTTTNTGTGSLTYGGDYIDPTYFASDYIRAQITVIFTG